MNFEVSVRVQCSLLQARLRVCDGTVLHNTRSACTRHPPHRCPPGCCTGVLSCLMSELPEPCLMAGTYSASSGMLHSVGSLAAMQAHAMLLA